MRKHNSPLFQKPKFHFNAISDTVPVADLCKTVTLSSYYISLYQTDGEQTLASASFFPRAPNVNSVVFNAKGVVGQITSDGIELQWEGKISSVRIF